MRAFRHLPSPAGRHIGAAALALLSLAAADLPAQAAGRSRDSAPAPVPPPVLPSVELRKLANGIEVAVMRDTRQPVVGIAAVLDIGPALDPADKTGIGEITKVMLRRGTTTRSAAQIDTAAGALKAQIGPTYVFGPVGAIDGMLSIFADQLLRPAFSRDALERVKRNAAANLGRGKDDVRFVAPVIFKSILYGAGHSYARRITEESIAAITRDDVVAFHAKYVSPPNVRFAVVGDVHPDTVVAKLDRKFGAWAAARDAAPAVPAPTAPAATKIYLHDRPGAAHSMVWVGGLGPRRDAPDYAAISVMNTVLGGSLTSRLNAALRDSPRSPQIAQSGFAFGPVPEPGVFAAFAPAPKSKTDTTLVAIMRELRDIREARPVTDEEFRRAHAQMTGQLAMELETVPQRVAALADLLTNRLPLDNYTTVGAKLAALTRGEVQAAARTHITPDQLVIVVVGDRAAVEPALRAADVAPVSVVDLNGAPTGTP